MKSLEHFHTLIEIIIIITALRTVKPLNIQGQWCSDLKIGS